MKFLFVSRIILILSIIFLNSCDKKNDNNPTAPGENNIVEITKNIEDVTIWKSEKIYVIKKWDFYVSNTLTIEAGAIIKFTTGGDFLTLGESGTIVANGSSDKPIIFTSYKDDAHGGDTNGDGKATTPARNDWGHINTNSYNGSIFNYCEFYYGGTGSNSSTLDIFNSRVTITNCTFAHNNGGTLNFQNESVLEASYAVAGTIIKGNVFYDNSRPLSISPKIDIDNSNIFHNPANAQEKNKYNGIYVFSSDENITSHITWGETEVPYIIDGGDFYVVSGALLTLGNDVVLKFTPGSILNLDDGVSALINHDGTGVYFTSYKDDNLKGDTNGDGTQTLPADNDWLGIYDNSGSTPDPFFFTWANIHFDSY